MVEALDTHYNSVKTQMATINASRGFAGMMEAQDWPLSPVKFEQLYLLTLGDAPLGRRADSAKVPIYVHNVQWVWVIGGTDLSGSLVGRNRGDRFRTNQIMKGELLKALFPRFAEKKDISAAAGGAVSFVSRVPPEHIVWTPAQFVKRVDQASGVVYMSASVNITDFTDEVPET